jgi:hypothetical protein
VELADIFRAHGEPYLAAHSLSREQAKAWRAIVGCRTEAMGGHLDQCGNCGTTRYVFHSCRNRHCPKCQTRAKEQWIAARHRELLPTPYFHLVFTLPHALNGLAGRHARAIYEMLFEAVAQTLTEFGANPRWLGGRLAFTLVLHTWAQNLARHIHLHALVAGGALAVDGQWLLSKRGFLFPVKALSRVFRGKFIAALEAQRSRGRMCPDAALTDREWRNLLAALRRHDWVVYAKQPLGGPAQVLDYLARYTHKVAISNERLVSLAHGQVAFCVRDSANGNRKRVEELGAETFIGRFLLHVLPHGLKRIRHYGVLANRHKAAKLAACRTAFQLPEPDPPLIETIEQFMKRVAQLNLIRCTRCNAGSFHVLSAIAPVRQLLHPKLATGPPRS